MQEIRYHIHNLTRSRETRMQRAKNAFHSKTVLFLGGSSVRIVRGRPVVVGESVIRRLHGELVRKEAQGLLKVTTPRGDRVDLTTLRPVVLAPVPPPVPKPLLDSINNDRNEGMGLRLPRLQGNADASEVLSPPKVGRRAIPEGDVSPEEVPREPQTEEVDSLGPTVRPPPEELPPAQEPVVVVPCNSTVTYIETVEDMEYPAEGGHPPEVADSMQYLEAPTPPLPEVEVLEASVAPTPSQGDPAPQDSTHLSRRGSRKKSGKRR